MENRARATSLESCCTHQQSNRVAQPYQQRHRPRPHLVDAGGLVAILGNGCPGPRWCTWVDIGSDHSHAKTIVGRDEALRLILLAFVASRGLDVLSDKGY